MKKDIDEVLKWQLNYNKSLKDLNTIFYDLTNFEKNEIHFSSTLHRVWYFSFHVDKLSL